MPMGPGIGCTVAIGCGQPLTLLAIKQTTFFIALWLLPWSMQAAGSSSSFSSPESELSASFLPLGDGDAIRLPHERPDAGPRFEYSRDEAINIQLQALKQNDKPYFDHGIEVLYRYANFDPFQRSKYFG